ncbi:MAG: mechanosensitive ion channel domain-containing protein [Ginsengibacter sp.]
MNFLDQVYFDNTLRSFIAVAITILLVLLLKRIFSKYATALVFKMWKTQWRGMNKQQFDSIIITPLERIFVAVITIFTLDRLTFPKAFIFSIHKVTSQDIVQTIASAIIIICIVSLILRFMDFLVQVIKHRSGDAKAASEYQLLFFFKDFIRVIIIIFGIIFILKFSLHLDIGNLLTGLSIVGAALALSARESLENLIASFVIFFDKPFETGDVVKVKDISGTVERIGLRSTRIRTNEKSLVTVPNKQMVDSVLDNWSSRDLVRNEIKTFLSANSTSIELEKTVSEIKEILSSAEKIHSYSVHLQEINDNNALVISVYFTPLILPAEQVNQLRQEINISIKKMQEKHNIQTSGSRMVTLVSPEKKL